jgi:hypothetical protein
MYVFGAPQAMLCPIECGKELISFGASVPRDYEN